MLFLIWSDNIGGRGGSWVINLHMQSYGLCKNRGEERESRTCIILRYSNVGFNLQYLGDHFPFSCIKTPPATNYPSSAPLTSFLVPLFLHPPPPREIIIHVIFHMFIRIAIYFASCTVVGQLIMVAVNNGKMADLIALLPEQWSVLRRP